MHMVVKGRQRDTDWYSIVGDEWPRCRDALLAWLDPANFAADGTALYGLADSGAGLRMSEDQPVAVAPARLT